MNDALVQGKGVFDMVGLQAFKRGAACPDFALLFDCRTISSGMFPTFHLIAI
jgi:hypothetical protein